MMNVYKARQALQGFTLLEVLLAMSLLSIMMVLLFASLASSAKSWNLGENKIAGVNQKALAYGFFKHYLVAARPVRTTNSTSIAFQGDEQSMEFVSHGPLSTAFRGLQKFRLSYQPSAEGGKIGVVLTPYVSGDEALDGAEEQVLLEGIASFQLEYFDREQGLWLEQWLERESLPALVKIRIGLIDHSDWPAMIFAMKLAGVKGETVMPALGL